MAARQQSRHTADPAEADSGDSGISVVENLLGWCHGSRRLRSDYFALQDARASFFAVLSAIAIKDKQANRRRQIAVPPLRINRSDKFGQGHVAGARDILQPLPERIFKADAGLVASDNDGTFNYWRFHLLVPPSFESNID